MRVDEDSGSGDDLSHHTSESDSAGHHEEGEIEIDNEDGPTHTGIGSATTAPAMYEDGNSIFDAETESSSRDSTGSEGLETPPPVTTTNERVISAWTTGSDTDGDEGTPGEMIPL